MTTKIPVWTWPLIALSALLAACGGGGGGTPGGGPNVVPSQMPTLSPTAPPNTTTASGVVVDDASGAPLAGTRIVLMPWTACGATPSPASSITPENDGCATPLPSPQATTNAQGQFTLTNAPNGHYLLVIGSDSTPTSGTVQATVHDNVTLSGGAQTLKAPVLPSPASGYAAPSWETNGDYRLATLNPATEMPCFVDWQNGRLANGVALGTADEWLLENTRAINAYFATGGSASVTTLLLTQNAGTTNGPDCSALLNPQFANTNFNLYISDPRALWFGAQYITSNGLSPANGYAEFMIDPRSYTNPNFPSWP